MATSKPVAQQQFPGDIMNEPHAYSYATHLDILFPALSLVDVPSLVQACTERWYNQTLCKVNDSVVRLGVMQGEYHWHKHDNDDEFFFVLDGHFIIDLEDKSIALKQQQGFVVPRGVVPHTRPRAGCHPDGRNGGNHSHRRCVARHQPDAPIRDFGLQWASHVQWQAEPPDRRIQ